MSRPLKFRVWSESDKENRSDCRLGELFTSVTGSPATIYNDEGDCFIIEQYTGLKDRNGKEIYEGDIVMKDLIGGSCLCKVEFNEKEAQYQADIFSLIGVEVIGNIHEPPKDLQPDDLKRMGVTITKGEKNE